jgi:hypothetical protein
METGPCVWSACRRGRFNFFGVERTRVIQTIHDDSRNSRTIAGKGQLVNICSEVSQLNLQVRQDNLLRIDRDPEFA